MTSLQRRQLLRVGGAGLALTLGGARLAWAATADRQPQGRLVVVLLRGALDGLAAVPAVGDADWARLRPGFAAEQERFGAALPLDGTFALHPRLPTMQQWWGQRELLVVHATATPYRERSHFDAQQLIESGGRRPFELDSGWLGRALAAHGGGLSALALGTGMPLALRGADGASHWSPAVEATADPGLLAALARLYAADPRLASSFARAHDGPDEHRLAMPATQPGMAGAGRADRGFVLLATQAGRMLAEADGPRVAWLELGGWDTHAQQAPRLNAQLGLLDSGLAALHRQLGPHWAQTSVLVMTEFGRSAAFNGSNGTDHGTGGVAFLAGGGVAGGRVLGDWPGLARAHLHEGRDLRPTTDLRALQRAVIDAHLPLPPATLEREVLPGAPGALRDLWRQPPRTA